MCLFNFLLLLPKSVPGGVLRLLRDTSLLGLTVDLLYKRRNLSLRLIRTASLLGLTVALFQNSRHQLVALLKAELLAKSIGLLRLGLLDLGQRARALCNERRRKTK